MSKKGKAFGLPIINARAAGIDIGSRVQVAAVPPGLSDEPVQTFQSFTADIERMADWLVSVGITTVAMESTGVSWIPVYEILEDNRRRPGLCGGKPAVVAPSHLKREFTVAQPNRSWVTDKASSPRVKGRRARLSPKALAGR